MIFFNSKLEDDEMKKKKTKSQFKHRRIQKKREIMKLINGEK